MGTTIKIVKITETGSRSRKLTATPVKTEWTGSSSKISDSPREIINWERKRSASRTSGNGRKRPRERPPSPPCKRLRRDEKKKGLTGGTPSTNCRPCTQIALLILYFGRSEELP